MQRFPFGSLWMGPPSCLLLVFGAGQVNVEVWATILALVWLHGIKSDAKDEWELLAMKAVLWLRARSGKKFCSNNRFQRVSDPRNSSWFVCFKSRC